MERRLEAPIIVATLLMVPVRLLHGGVLFSGPLQAHRMARAGARSGRATRASVLRGEAANTLAFWIGPVTSGLVERLRPAAS